jgi:hypothetical protein
MVHKILYIQGPDKISGYRHGLREEIDYLEKITAFVKIKAITGENL